MRICLTNNNIKKQQNTQKNHQFAKEFYNCLLYKEHSYVCLYSLWRGA